MTRLLAKLTIPVAVAVIGIGLFLDGSPSPGLLRAAVHPSPTAQPSLPAGDAAARLVETPFVRPDFSFRTGVSAADRRFVRKTVRQANAFFSIPHEPGFHEAAVYVFGDRDELIDHFAYRMMISPASAERQWEQIGGAALPGWTTMDLSIPFPSQDHKREMVFHEWFHVLAFDLQGIGQEPPQWLAEGMAEWAGWQAVARFGTETSFDQLRAEMRARAQGTTAPLSSMRTWKGFSRADPALAGAYATAFWAIEFLDPTVNQLVRFYQRVGEIMLWKTAFRDVFGISVDRFYKGFERFRSRGFA